MLRYFQALKVVQMITQPAGFIRIPALVIAIICTAAGCASSPASWGTAGPSHSKPASVDSVGRRAVAVALDQIGVPYRYGGNGPGGFDCSGLVQYSYARAGKSVPRTTRQLWSSTQSVKRQEIRAGDLLFFEVEGKMSHVGLYIGHQRFVHAPSSGRSVSVESLDSPFYAQALLRAGRPR